MKQKETPLKYILMSGNEEIIRTTNIKGICEHLDCSFPWIYANKHKDINKDGSWSFNFNNYNYTIKSI